MKFLLTAADLRSYETQTKFANVVILQICRCVEVPRKWGGDASADVIRRRCAKSLMRLQGVGFCTSHKYTKVLTQEEKLRNFWKTLIIIGFFLCFSFAFCIDWLRFLFRSIFSRYLKYSNFKNSKPPPIPANIRALLNQISRELQKYNHQLELFRLHHHQNPYC